MIKLVNRLKVRAASPIVLANRARYIEDQIHPDHGIKKVVMPSANFGCPGQSPKDFLKPTREAHALGKKRTDNRKGGGNPTTDLFLEIIVNNPEWVITTPEERDAIDQIMVEKFRDCYIRRGWHLAAQGLVDPPDNWKQLDDGHYLISARNRYGIATMNRFGAGKQTFVSWRNQIDQQICDMLNSTREVKVEPVHVVHRRNLGERLGTKLTKLCQLIAHSTFGVVTRANLAIIIEQLTKPSAENPKKEVQLATVTNDDLTLQDDKVVLVHFTGRQKPKNYRIEKLLLDIAEVQLDLEPKGEEEGFSGGGSSGSGGGGGASAAPIKIATVETKPFHPKLPHPVPVAKKAAKKTDKKRKKSKTKNIPPEPEI